MPQSEAAAATLPASNRFRIGHSTGRKVSLVMDVILQGFGRYRLPNYWR